MLGLGLGIDYSLFIVSRFRDELAARDVPDAVGVAMATAGRAVLFSGLTVMIGLLGLMTFTSPRCARWGSPARSSWRCRCWPP